MGVATDRYSRTINALAIGIEQGRTGNGTVQGNNTTRLQHYATAGYSVYFPDGEYEFSGQSINWDTATQVKIWGDNAKLYQVTPNVRLLDLLDVVELEICGLHFHTHYFDSRTPTAQGTVESAIYARRCQNLNIHDNIFEGYNTQVCCVQGGRTITIRNNQFKDGHFVAGGGFVDTADIKIQPETIATGVGNAEEIIITGNHCNSNSLLGISSLYPARNIICCDNVVVSKDENGVEQTTYNANLRKSGIELQYYMSPTTGNDDADSSQYEMNINNNKIQGCRFSGITYQASPPAGGHTGGARGTCANNNLRYVGLEQQQAPLVTDYVTGGICFQNYRDITITGNVIKDIENDLLTEAGVGTAAIHLFQTNQRSRSTGGTLSSAVVTGNIITSVRGRGIYCGRNGDTVITGNILRDVEGQNLYTVVPPGATERSGRTLINGNKFASEKQVSDDVLRVDGGNNEANYSIVNNQFDMTGTFTGGWACILASGTKMTISDNRFVGPADANSVGLKFGTSRNERYDNAVIGNNHFENLAIGMSSFPAAGRGPWVVNNTSFINCTANIEATVLDNIYPGHWVNGSANNNTQAVVYVNFIPTQGEWVQGDIVYTTTPTTGNPMGWVCSVGGSFAGTPPTFIPLPSLP